MSENKFIYCPSCGKQQYPEISGGTDGTLSGQWTCNNSDCGSVFVVTFEVDF